ncbi:MAG: ribonuclease T2 [Pseudomonadota bacterium]
MSVLGTGNAARANTPGDFDYYVMALSWQPSWCAREGDARDADSCDARHDHGWVLHGLWPQYEDGWPEFCEVPRLQDPSRADSAQMVDIMGSGGLAWYQWRKHGRCTGLSGVEYYRTSRDAYDSVTRPPVFRQLPRSLEIPARVVEEAWLEANPELSADQITITCRDGYVAEARICLTKDLEPRRCGRDVIRDCTATVRMDPVR